jgi:hypothetical protein
MTTPASSQPSAPGAASVLVPIGVRIASTLCWIVGILTILVNVAVGIPAISAGGSLLFVAVNLVAGGAVCLAALLIRRQRRLGVLVMLLGWALPTLVLLLNHQSARGSFLLFVALVFAVANWKHLR